MSLSAGRLAEVACLLEVSARKPGNVHRFRDFDDLTYLDFALSAGAIAGPMDRARDRGVGRTILEAVEATREVAASNTNLGMVLLLAPLAAAFGVPGPLRDGVRHVLDGLTVEDAEFAYRAIRLASPGGLGSVESEDVAASPSVTLLQAMTLAADRDDVARQYARGYVDVFDVTLPALRAAIAEGQPLEDAIIRAFLATLAARPDTLIRRKRGEGIAAEASRRAGQALSTGDLDALDAWLRDDGHSRNPGTTADLTAASLFVALADGTIRLPLRGRFAGRSGQIRLPGRPEIPENRPQ